MNAADVACVDVRRNHSDGNGADDAEDDDDDGLVWPGFGCKIRCDASRQLEQLVRTLRCECVCAYVIFHPVSSRPCTLERVCEDVCEKDAAAERRLPNRDNDRWQRRGHMLLRFGALNVLYIYACYVLCGSACYVPSRIAIAMCCAEWCICGGGWVGSGGGVVEW